MKKIFKTWLNICNQLSDMFTNIIGVVFGVFVLCIGVNSVFLVMQLFLCVAEIFGHIEISEIKKESKILS